MREYLSLVHKIPYRELNLYFPMVLNQLSQEISDLAYIDRIFSEKLEALENGLQAILSLPQEDLSQLNAFWLDQIQKGYFNLKKFQLAIKENNKEGLSNCFLELYSFYEEFEKKYKKELQVLKEKNSKKIIKKINQEVKNIPQGVLFHGVKLEYIQEILERGSILGYTSQRFWDDGKRFKDKDPEYQDSYWMKGISMTRDFNFALNWGSVVLIFNKESILKRHPVESYNWAYHISDRTSEDNKKEMEDFVVLSKKNKKYKNIDNPIFKEDLEAALKYDPKESEDPEGFEKYKQDLIKKSQETSIELLKKPEGEFKFSNQDLVGIVLRGASLDIYGLENPVVSYILNHEKFLGIVDKD